MDLLPERREACGEEPAAAVEGPLRTVYVIIALKSLGMTDGRHGFRASCCIRQLARAPGYPANVQAAVAAPDIAPRLLATSGTALECGVPGRRHGDAQVCLNSPKSNHEVYGAGLDRASIEVPEGRPSNYRPQEARANHREVNCENEGAYQRASRRHRPRLYGVEA